MFDDRSLDAAGHLYVPHDDKAISLRGPLPCHSFRAPYEPPSRDLSASDVSYMSDPSRTDPSEPPDHPSRRSADSPPSPAPQRKRMRSYRQEEEEAERERSSPSPSVASSQEELQESSHQFAADLNPSSNQQPPPKKKRTRTLTTPQQSAELHALLAKSRFPTTAEREEVGRRIGLSARKVQVWFQNQRQKAKRPKPDADPRSQAQQPGVSSFPAASSSYSHEGSLNAVTQFHVVTPESVGRTNYYGTSSRHRPPSVGPAAVSPIEPQFQPYPPAPVPPRQQERDTLPPIRPPRLTGPGVPGEDIHRGYQTAPHPVSPPMSDPYRPTSHSAPYPGTVSPTDRYRPHDSRRSGLEGTRGSEGPHYPRPVRGQGSPITLPPPHLLHAGSPPGPRSGSSTSPMGIGGRFMAPDRSRPPPQQYYEPPPPSTQGFSRPFTLQPDPQWSTSSDEFLSRRPRQSSSGGLTSPVGGRSQASPPRSFDTEPGRQQPLPPIRTTRFDPVRASSMEQTASSGSPRPATASPTERRTERH